MTKEKKLFKKIATKNLKETMDQMVKDALVYGSSGYEIDKKGNVRPLTQSEIQQLKYNNTETGY